MLMALEHFIKDLNVKYMLLGILLGGEQNSVQTETCFPYSHRWRWAKLTLNEVSLTCLL